MKRFFTLFILILFASAIFAQSNIFNQGSIKEEKYVQKIPYQNVNGKLLVPVTINGKQYTFLFDTGASFAISHKLYQEINPPIIGQAITGDITGQVKDINVILLPMLHLGGITFIDTPGGIYLEESAKLFECFGVYGIIGSNMLRNSVVQFDEQSKHIFISNSFYHLPKKRARLQKMKVTDSSKPVIKVVLQNGKQRANIEVLFDTGASDMFSMAIRSYNFFNERVDVTNKIAESEGSFIWGMHGWSDKQQHVLLSIPELIVNRMPFKDVIITTSNTISTVGTQLLQYGKVTLDYPKKRFYFEHFDNVNKNKLSERPWAIHPTMQDDKLVVGIIWDKELESQINLGDEILSINGVDI